VIARRRSTRRILVAEDIRSALDDLVANAEALFAGFVLGGPELGVRQGASCLVSGSVCMYTW
jgi:hypothetical protein